MPQPKTSPTAAAIDARDVRGDVLAFVRKLVGSRLTAGMELGPDTDFVREKLLDSMDMVDVLEHVETTYSIKIRVQELTRESFASADAIAELVLAVQRRQSP